MKRTVMLALAVVVVALCMAAVGAASAAALLPDGDQGWYWQIPQPSRDWQGLNDVAMPTASKVWAVGPSGTIIHSLDGGVTWAPQASGTAVDLFSVAFPDDHDGWAVGGDGRATVLRTIDGGATWTERSPPPASASALSSTDAAHCWLGSDQGGVLRTTDGGATWSTTRLGAYNGHVEVAFVDALHGWAAGDRGRIWRTEDGGATWQALSAGGLWTSVGDSATWTVRFTGLSRGWLLLDTLSSKGWQLWTTADGGVTWSSVLKRSSSFAAASLTAGPPSTAWVFSLAGVADPRIPQVTSLDVTTDGGSTWSRTSTGSTPWGPLAQSGGVFCAVGQGLVRSADGGLTWTSGLSGKDYAFSGADAVAGDDVWAAGSGVVLHSADGVRWIEQAGVGDGRFRAVSFPDAVHGWAVGGAAATGRAIVSHTGDGGATWTAQRSALTGQLTGVDFVDAQRGWAISGVGLERTVDGGATWSVQKLPRRAELNVVSFLDASRGWVGGAIPPSGKNPGSFVPCLFATTNGGVTWKTVPVPASAQMVLGVQFFDRDNGWVVAVGVGSGAWAARTSDGGATWRRASGFNKGELLMALRFADTQHGWIGGYQGVYGTADGGASWKLVAPGVSTRVIAAADLQHVWAFGWGAVASTVDAAGDVAAPDTLDDADWLWHNSPVTLQLWPNDVGGSGLASTRYSLDSGVTWRDGSAIGVAAPVDHSADGAHEIRFRSADVAGNVEATKSAKVFIDTLGPTCGATKATVNVGERGILRFRAADATSGVAQAVITISDFEGSVLRSFTLRAGTWSVTPPPRFYWLPFTADLRPGYYRVTVHATDRAGNPQVLEGHNLLHVMRVNAPKALPPAWPAGLPSGPAPAGVSAAGATASSMALPTAPAAPGGVARLREAWLSRTLPAQ